MSGKLERPYWVYDDDERVVEQRTLTVIDVDQDRWSGLYNIQGQKLYRKEQPFGFRCQEK